jgi:competence protein ComEC
VLLLLGYGAGLATGLAHFQSWPCIIVVLLAAALWRSRGRVGLLAGAAVLGTLAGLTARMLDDRSCAARLPREASRMVLRLEEPALPDAPTGTARVLGEGCQGEVWARWPPGTTLQAGAAVAAEGRWIPQPEGWRAGGLFVVRAFTSSDRSPGLRERIRNWLARTTRELYGARAGTVEALVINRRTAMSPELKQRYAQAGLVHILSISGFHVGVILAWIALALRLLGVAPARRHLWAACGAVPYVLLLAWPAPAARACLLALVVAVERARQRHAQATALLAAACLLVLLCDPWAIADPGAWLSALALWGAASAVRWSDHALGPSWGWRTLAGSLGATLATAPLTAALFGTVSLAGIGLNFVAIPLAALAIPGLFLSLLAAPGFPWLAQRLAGGAGLLLAGLDRLAWWGGGLPHAYLAQPIGWTSALPWVAIAALAGWGIAGRRGREEAARRWSLGLAVLAWLSAFVAAGGVAADAAAGRGLSLHFLDVGQGDAAVIGTPGGHWVVVDAGPRDDRRDAGRRIVAPFLASGRAGRISVLVVTHPHADHMGGAVALLERFPTDLVLEPAELIADPLYTGFLDEVAVAAAPWRAARPGIRFELDSVRFTVLHPDTLWSGWREDLNEDSVVLLVEYRRFRALLAGDAGIPAEGWLHGRVGDVALLKVGHHGSRSATGAAWLAELRPEVAVVSVGAGNRYGHPHPEVLARLRQAGASVWRTDESGSISVWTDGSEMRVAARARTERRSLGDAVPRSDSLGRAAVP